VINESAETLVRATERGFLVEAARDEKTAELPETARSRARRRRRLGCRRQSARDPAGRTP
jgi:hypothetical protein